MKRSLASLWIKSALVVAVLLFSATLLLPWIQLDDVFYNGLKVCTDGMSYGVAVQGDPGDLSAVERTVVGISASSGGQVLFDLLEVPYAPLPFPEDVTHSGVFTSTWNAPLPPGSKVRVEQLGGRVPLVTVEDCTLAQEPPQRRTLYSSEQPTLIPAVRVAYVYDTDLASRDSFVEMLAPYGFAVQTLTVSEAESFDFATVEAIIIGDDTGALSEWGSSAALLNLSTSARAIIGVGEGGYAFFGQLGLAIGWPNGAHGTDSQVVVPDPTPAVYSDPAPLFVPADRRLELFVSAVESIEIPAGPTLPEGVTAIGRSSDNADYYPLLSEYTASGCYLLWGFRGTPDQMTLSGQTLFRNALQTPSCSLLFCSTPALAIPDGDEAGASNTLDVPTEGTVAGLRVHLRATHTWVGDLSFSLEHEGRTVTLIDRPGVPETSLGCSGDDIDAILDDGASEPVEGACADTPPTITGTFLPEEPLAPFKGVGLAGAWTLTAVDQEERDEGTLDEWCIEALLGRAPTLGRGGGYLDDHGARRLPAWRPQRDAVRDARARRRDRSDAYLAVGHNGHALCGGRRGGQRFWEHVRR